MYHIITLVTLIIDIVYKVTIDLSLCKIVFIISHMLFHVGWKGLAKIVFSLATSYVFLAVDFVRPLGFKILRQELSDAL